MRLTRMTMIVAGLGAIAALTACGEKAEVAAAVPAALTRAATGHYCRMIVVDHKGPKGQIHVAGRKTPVWFSSVRDTLAFTMLPEEPKRISAIYVNDMTQTNWERPGPKTWINAKTALYVIGSSRRGGMGASEAVPFKGRAAADAFAKRFGGRVVAFGQIPRKYILGESGTAPSYGADRGGHGGHEGHKSKGSAGVLEAGGEKSKANTPMMHGKHGKPGAKSGAHGGSGSGTGHGSDKH